MRYFLSASLVALSLVGCSSNSTDKNVEQNMSSNAMAESQVINFTGENGLAIELKSTDNFETATLSTNQGKTFTLKRASAASGIFMTDGSGASIHFKAGEGILELEKDKPIGITEVKK